jgi:MFS superfamily sulfate permease-like transporter
VAERPEVRHVVLMCSAINAIDASALESLEEINHRLSDAGIKLHLSEVKGPVMDRLSGPISSTIFRAGCSCRNTMPSARPRMAMPEEGEPVR